MKALVTGATGFIGSHIVRELVRTGHSVRAFTRRRSDRSALAGMHVEIAEGDLADMKSLRRACRGCDVVFHAAGMFTYWTDDKTLFDTMVTGTIDAVDAAADAGVERFVLTSSSVTLGSSTKAIPRDESDRMGAEPGPVYFRAKALQERAAFARAAERAMPLIAVLPTMTVGPNDAKLVPSNAVIVRYIEDPYHVTFPGGCNIVGVRDVARGHVLAAFKGKPGQRYVLGSENLEWSLIHRIVSELCNISAPTMMVNETFSYLSATVLEWFAHMEDKPPALTRAQAETVGRFYWYRHDRASALGYSPASARRALADATAWLLSSGHIDPSIARSIRPSPELRIAREVER
ncbi:MAG TPA: NAD-dependent epimerase/dehydratase family protein [Candidatus Baltobacteraceae bacterium]|nr:NAD-dependent epimerase/dehydratase family protein [Candidatus Baltobacteraceae bacterium]